MYLLKKIFQLRDQVNPDHEKPFLEHLEDLRVMVTRVVITLLVAMLACFTFQEKLMEILRRPVDQVWEAQIIDKLPSPEDGAAKPLDLDTWEKAKSIDHAVLGLDAPHREAFFKALGDDNLRFHAESVGLLRASLALPDAKRAAFIEALPDSADMKKQAGALLKKSPSPEVDNRGNLRLMSALRPTETFMLSMKLSFFAGIVVSFPLLLMFILQFILPGLHTNEKKVLWPSLAIGFGLFLGGVCFAYYGVLPRALGFFYEWSAKLGVSNDWRIGEYITFATQFTLLFGLSFELPVVVMVLVKLGLLTYETMSKTRSYAIVAIFVAAAILTPTPDVFTLSLMALPMVILYEICIWLAWLHARKERRAEEAEAREREARRQARIAAGIPDDPEPEPEPTPDDNGYPAPDHTEAESTEESGDHGWQTEYPDLTPYDHPIDPPYQPDPTTLPGHAGDCLQVDLPETCQTAGVPDSTAPETSADSSEIPPAEPKPPAEHGRD